MDQITIYQMIIVVLGLAQSFETVITLIVGRKNSLFIIGDIVFCIGKVLPYIYDFHWIATSHT